MPEDMGDLGHAAEEKRLGYEARMRAEEEIRRIIDKYTPILFLERCTFELKYGCLGEGNTMEYRSRYPYLDCTLAYSDVLVKQVYEKKDISLVVVHEMVHALTNAFYDKAIARYVSRRDLNNEEENLVDLIAMIVTRNLAKEYRTDIVINPPDYSGRIPNSWKEKDPLVNPESTGTA